MSVQSPTDQQVADLLQWLRTTAESSAEFVKEQAPDVARGIIAWGVWGNAVPAALWVLFGVACGYVSKRIIAHWRSDDMDIDEGKSFASVFVGVFSIMGTLIAFAVTPSYVLPAIKALVAPKLYLLEWIMARL